MYKNMNSNLPVVADKKIINISTNIVWLGLTKIVRKFEKTNKTKYSSPSNPGGIK